ncbi:MAG: hypothetical protein ABGW95_03895 [Candidatus Poseidoniia archaeon]
MATFEDETEPETPSAEASIYIMKTAIGREQTAGERLADRVRRSGAPVLLCSTLRIAQLCLHPCLLSFVPRRCVAQLCGTLLARRRCL